MTHMHIINDIYYIYNMVNAHSVFFRAELHQVQARNWKTENWKRVHITTRLRLRAKSSSLQDEMRRDETR